MAIELPCPEREWDDECGCEVVPVTVMNNGFAWVEYRHPETGAVLREEMCDEDEEAELYGES